MRRHLSATLPEYMTPAAYVRLAKLPLTPNGKVDRKALPAPETDAYWVREYEEPKGEAERALAEIWADVLKVERVGRHDNFFELGGHSLLVVRVIARLRQVGLDVDVRTLFVTPVLAELAAEIGSRRILVEVPPNGIPPGCEVITPEMLPLVQLTAEEIERIVKGAGWSGERAGHLPAGSLTGRDTLSPPDGRRERSLHTGQLVQLRQPPASGKLPGGDAGGD